MPSLIILRGNSGSGKTTTARALQEAFGRNTMLLSQDAVRREMLRVKDGPHTEALPLLEALLRYGRAHSEVVILEGILSAAWYRPLFELAVRLYGNRVFAYYFDLPFKETLRRHQTRVKRDEFGEAEMRRWWCEKDFSDVLDERRITPAQNLPGMVRDIRAAVEGR